MATGLNPKKQMKAKRRLLDIRTDRVDLVNRAANKRRFLVCKMEDPMPETGVQQFSHDLAAAIDFTSAISVLDVAKNVVTHLTKCAEVVDGAQPEVIEKATQAAGILQAISGEIQDLEVQLAKADDLSQDVLDVAVASLTKQLDAGLAAFPQEAPVVAAPIDAASAAEPVAKQESTAAEVATDTVVATEAAATTEAVSTTEVAVVDASTADATVVQKSDTEPATEQTAKAAVEVVVETTVEVAADPTPVQKSEETYRDKMLAVLAAVIDAVNVQKSEGVGIEQLLSPVAMLSTFEARLVEMGYITKVAPESVPAGAAVVEEATVEKTEEPDRIDVLTTTVAKLAKQVEIIIKSIADARADIAKSRDTVPARAGAQEAPSTVTPRVPRSVLFPHNFNDPDYKELAKRYFVR